MSAVFVRHNGWYINIDDVARAGQTEGGFKLYGHDGEVIAEVTEFAWYEAMNVAEPTIPAAAGYTLLGFDFTAEGEACGSPAAYPIVGWRMNDDGAAAVPIPAGYGGTFARYGRLAIMDPEGRVFVDGTRLEDLHDARVHLEKQEKLKAAQRAKAGAAYGASPG